MSISISGSPMKFETRSKAKPVNSSWSLDKMKVYSIASTGFTVSVGCFLLFIAYVHLTSQNIQFHAVQRDQSYQQPNDKDRIAADFMKNMNESIKRMDYDKEYASKNLTLGGPETVDNAETEDDENLNPLFLDVMKVTRLRQSEKRGLPDAKVHHDLSGYQSILHPEESQLDLHCKTCSVVCSSGHLLHSKFGRTIDSADCVFRMNDAPSRGFSKDVGSRTSLRMIGFQAVPKVLEGKDTLLKGSSKPRYLVMWGPERELVTNGTGKGYNHLKALAMMLEKQGTQCFVLTEKEMAYNNRLYEEETGQNRSKTGSWLTTGWFTMILARSVCSEIHVYGMVGENYCKREHGQKHPYHYYNLHSQDECTYYRQMERSYKGGHRFMTEKAIFASWANLSPKIYFHQPEWK